MSDSRKQEAIDFIAANNGKSLVTVTARVRLSHGHPTVTVSAEKGGLAIYGSLNKYPYKMKQSLKDDWYIDAGSSIPTTSIKGLHFDKFEVSSLGAAASCHGYILEDAGKAAITAFADEACRALDGWIMEYIAEQEAIIAALLKARSMLQKSGV